MLCGCCDSIWPCYILKGTMSDKLMGNIILAFLLAGGVEHAALPCKPEQPAVIYQHIFYNG